jgi:hypothetical protein
MRVQEGWGFLEVGCDIPLIVDRLSELFHGNDWETNQLRGRLRPP